MTLEKRFWEKVDKRDPNECWPWTGSKSRGYGDIYRNGKMVKATHIAYLLANGEEVSPGLCACHTCDNPGCVNPAHLFVGTKAANNRDRAEKGRGNSPAGEKNSNSRLTQSQVDKIRKLYVPHSKDFSLRILAQMFGVHKTTISRIVTNKTWKTA